MHTDLLWLIFAAVMVGFMVVDLGILNRRPHAVSLKSAALQSVFWVAISLAYAGCVYVLAGHNAAADFVSAYVAEKALSLDNLFVMMLIFAYFKVKDEYQHRVLYWGILGAVVFRATLILSGTAIVGRFHWILYIFAVLLISSALKLLFGKGDDDGFDANNNKVFNWAQRHLRVAREDHGDKFFVRTPAGKFVTLLFVILLVIETTDILFAFDSIPAVLSITQNPLIAFTSNIFAVMGLRALFFLVDKIMSRLQYLQTGLSFVLLFIGVKMLLGIVHVEISSLVSFGVIMGLLVGSSVISLLKKPEPEVA